MRSRLVNRLRRWWLQRELTVFHDPAYRLPLANLEGQVGMEPRRADFVAWFLLDRGVLPQGSLRTPVPVTWEDLALVHDDAWLDSITRAETLARVFAATPTEIPVDALLHSARLACGGTLEAARLALRTGRPVLNLLGGFHHAGKGFGGGFCVINDLAIAIAKLRAEKLLTGKVVVLDLDAHPPDGTADCLEGDPNRWIGSISGTACPLPAWVDELVLPPRTGDEAYLANLGRLLVRMPRPALAFVLAGGDVLAGDRLGGLGLSVDGARRRDLAVRHALEGVPSVWVPAGGYSRDAWKVLAGTALALALDSRRPVPEGYDPLSARFRAISAGLARSDLGPSEAAEDEGIEVMLGLRRARRNRLLLGYYSAQGVEQAFSRLGLLAQIARLGYSDFRIDIDQVDQGDRLRLFGRARGAEHLLLEVVEEKKRIAGADMLYVHWLTLRHPIATFDETRPRLPGQEVPGLGLAREAGEVLVATARRLGLAGVAFCPAWFHTAYAARYHFRFVDVKRQGRFLALMRDLAHVPLLAATLALADKRVLLDGAPYTWEADEMAFWLDRPPTHDPEAVVESEKVRFTLPAAG